MKSYVVIGLGRFGREIAKRLCAMGADVMVLDIRQEEVQPFSDIALRAVVGDARDKELLRTVGVQDFDCAIVGIGSDLASAALTTVNLKELGVPKILCKASDETYRTVLEKVGADKIIIPERDVADRLARELCSPNLLDFFELSRDHSIAEILAPKNWVGKTLRKLNLRAKYQVNVIAIKRKGNVTAVPGADDEILPDDQLVLLGKNDALEAIQKIK